jgi:hypothetical protein
MIIHKPNPQDGVLKFVVRSEDESRAYLDAAIEAAREAYDRGNALRLDVGKLGDVTAGARATSRTLQRRDGLHGIAGAAPSRIRSRPSRGNVITP